MNFPTLLYLPGWAHVRAARMPPLSPRMPPLHLSPREEFPYADALSGILAQATQPITLIGWSIGGMAALEAAARFPGKISALVLLGVTPCFCLRQPGYPGVSATRLQTMRDNLHQNPRAVLRDFFIQAALPQTCPDNELERKIAAALEIGIGVLAAGLDYLMHVDLRETIKTIRQPAMLLHGQKDRITTCRAIHLLQAGLPHASAEILPDAGHLLPEQHAGLVHQRIHTFLENLS